MVTVNAVYGQELSIGKRGEGGVTRVAFDLSGLLAEFGEGTAQLMAVRPQEEVAYLALLTREGDTVYWEITPEWTAFHGMGACQLCWYVDGALKKSEIFSFCVEESLADGNSAPEPAQQFLEQVGALAVRAEEAADRAVRYMDEVLLGGAW